MAKKQGKQNHERMVISVCHVATPDAEGRLRRAMEILLRAAARDTSQAEDSPDADKEKPANTRQDGGDGEMSNGNDANLSHE